MSTTLDVMKIFMLFSITLLWALHIFLHLFSLCRNKYDDDDDNDEIIYRKLANYTGSTYIFLSCVSVGFS